MLAPYTPPPDPDQPPDRRPMVIAVLGLLAFWLLVLALGRQIQIARSAELPPIIGRVVVTDGDTIFVAGRNVRLTGIDAPEIGQSCADAGGRPWRCGRAAADALDQMVGGRTVVCRQDSRDAVDRYGRALARCSVGETDAGEAMLRQGMAIAYRRFLDWPQGGPRPWRAAYLAAEEDARNVSRGLWAGRFDAPEDWRRARSSPRSP